MIVKYIKNGIVRKTKKSNDDLTIIQNSGNCRKTVSLVALTDITLIEVKRIIPFHVNFQDLYFLNGYQSWTDTKEYSLFKRLRNVKKSPHIITKKFGLDKYGDSTFYNYSIKKSHGYDVFYCKGEFEAFIFNVNSENAYLLIELIKDKRDLYVTSLLKGTKLAKGEKFKVFDYYYYDTVEEGLESFRTYYPEITKTQKIFGYTSWYNYYQKISEDIILRDLDALDSRFNIFQIDDGYETFVGDWLDVDPVKFPNGLKPIVDKIHEKGFKAGIWLAPFAVEKNSKTFKEHPEWLRKNKLGKPILTGGNWSTFYTLDFDNKEAMDYVRKFLTHYVEMGFDFFKLDFLYCIAVPDYPGRNRCQVQNAAYQMLRDILGDKLILGCGANIINSYNKFDYLRIGPDVSLAFDDTLVMRLFHRERISTKITLQNTIFRSIFDHHLFLNDPDVFLLRDDNIQLSFAQRFALIKLNALFGSVLFTSDNIATYDAQKKRVLEEALDIFYNAKVISYETVGNAVNIVYSLHDIEHQLSYDISKGVFVYDR